MKRRTFHWAVCGGPLLGLCVLWSISVFAGEPPAPDRPAGVNALREEVASLKADLKRLEVRIDELTQQNRPGQILQLHREVQPPQDGDRDRIPEEWTPKEFNGFRYYIVPVSGRAKVTDR